MCSQQGAGFLTFEHMLVDDASTDGTAQAVKQHFPDVRVLEGTGTLYWAGGMRYGWENCVRTKAFDYLFVYNDDVQLRADAVLHLWRTSKRFIQDTAIVEHAIVGAFHDSAMNETTYSGQAQRHWWNPLSFQRVDPPLQGYMQVETMNMNGCLISGVALRRFGFLAGYFIHSGADFEYGLRLTKAGGAVILAPGYLGICERNPDTNQINVSTNTFRDCFAQYTSPKYHPVKERFRFYRQHGGILWIFLWLWPYVRLSYRYILFKFREKLKQLIAYRR